MADSEFISWCFAILKSLKQCEEILIDVNPQKDMTSVYNILEDLIFQAWHIYSLPVVITTTYEVLESLPASIVSSPVKFDISLKEPADSDIELLTALDCVRCINIVDTQNAVINSRKRRYITDKFAGSWRNFVEYCTTLGISQQITSPLKLPVLNYTDDCITTVATRNPCPASTQLNLYKDGSVRRCPYMPRDQRMDKTRSFYDCKFIRESSHNGA
jgi:hypothetical protein